jgi:hypothetical protein
MGTRFFQSTAHQNAFDKDGFIKVPFLTPSLVDRLYSAYLTLQPAHEAIGIPFITTSHSNNYNLISDVDQMIADVFVPEMDRLLIDYELLFGNFLIKQPGHNSITPPHQDTTFVDENEFSSFSIWVSLQDTDKQNGCMRFIKGSHKFLHTERPAHAYPWVYENVKDRLEALLVDYPSNKGEAFIFHHGVIHASYPNLSDRPRVAALMAGYPKTAELLMLFQNPINQELLQTYSMNKDAFLHFVKGKPPILGKLKAEKRHSFNTLSAKEFEQLLPKKPSVIKRLLHYFIN